MQFTLRPGLFADLLRYAASGRKTLSVLALIACCQFPVAQAGTITLDETDSGNIDIGIVFGTVRDVFHRDGFDRLSSSVRAGGIFGAAVDLQTGYLIFDLSGVEDPVTGGSIGLDIGINTSTTPEATIDAFELGSISATDLAMLPEGPLSVEDRGPILDAFSMGGFLGSLDPAAFVDDGVYELALTDSAIDLINSTENFLAVGISLVSAFFDDFSILSPSTLTLETEEASPVPAPGTFTLLGFGLVGLG